jgi:hypothetical protein
MTAEGREVACAGWLAVVGREHLAVRFAVAVGRLSPAALEPAPDWPALFSTYTEMAQRQGRGGGMTIRILVTVSRSFREYPRMQSVAKQLHERYPDAVVVHGNCDPGDVHFKRMWNRLGGKDDPWDADWPTCAPTCRPGHRKVNRRSEEYCPTAGHRRDKEMVESAPDRVMAFLDPKSRTKGAITTAQRAVDAGIPTVICRQGVPGLEVHNLAEEAGIPVRRFETREGR